MSYSTRRLHSIVKTPRLALRGSVACGKPTLCFQRLDLLTRGGIRGYTSSMSVPSVQTVATTVRITPAQRNALKRHSISASVIIRVLLQRWLDGAIDADEAIAEENKRTQDAITGANKPKAQIAA